MLKVHQIPVLSDNYIYLLHDTDTEQTAVVDPAVAEPVLEALQSLDLSLNYILNTHHHSDHIGGNLKLKAATACQVVGAESDKKRIPLIDITLKEGDVFQLGSEAATIIETDGHTIGHIAFWFKNAEALFCGDTLFAMGCGRLFEGSAEQMWQSLNKLTALPTNTQIYCTHEYTEANGRFALTIEPKNADLKFRMQQVKAQRAQGLATVPFSLAEELATNPFLRAESSSSFAEIRTKKDNFNG
ncbi:MAG: hydroxyacylglutathione hydrolase [Methylococcaceae bacterium]|nr:hydroxyacylglutathione hydrolase [Methylococcaceae bacterium]